MLRARSIISVLLTLTGAGGGVEVFAGTPAPAFVAATAATAPLVSTGDDPLNAVCPVLTDEPIDATITLEWEGHTVAFCCKMCRADFREDPDAFRDRIPELAALLTTAGTGSGPAASHRHDDDETLEGNAPGARAATTPSAAVSGADDDGLVLPAWVGRIHVLSIHFPIGLLVAAALAEFLTRKREGARTADAAHVCLLIGMLSAGIAAFTGWTYAEGYTITPYNEDTVFWHRWLGIATLGLSLLALLSSWRARRPTATSGAVARYRVLLLLTAVCVGFSAHYGGTLVYGDGFPFS